MFKTKEEIEVWLAQYNIKNYTINQDLTVDVKGDIVIKYLNEDVLPIQFGKIEGNIIINTNTLSSLKGCPQEVYGTFNVSMNQLTSLEYCPQIITESLIVSNNYLTTLKGSPEKVESFLCNGNQLTSLQYGPQKVVNYDVTNNKLVTLEGAPEVVSFFIASQNELKNLKGCPKIVSGELHLNKNKLENLNGFPAEVKKAQLKNNPFDISECINLNIKETIIVSYHNKEENEVLESHCKEGLRGLEIDMSYHELNKILLQEQLNKELPSHPITNKVKL